MKRIEMRKSALFCHPPMSDEDLTQQGPRGLLTLVNDISLSDNEEEQVESVPNPESNEKHMASSEYYWNSYAHFGIHEVGVLFLRLLFVPSSLGGLLLIGNAQG